METQRIVLFGANTEAGGRILTEALSRGYKVTTILPRPEKVAKSHTNLTKLEGNIMNKNDIRSKLKGYDVVINVYDVKMDPLELYRGTTNLIDAIKLDDVRQLIVLGHPSAYETEPSLPIPVGQEGWKAVSEAQRKTLDALENETDFCWSYIHQPALTDTPRKPAPANKIFIKNSENEQYYPVQNFHKTVVDEVERFTEAHIEKI